MDKLINPDHFVLTMEERLGLGLGVDAFLYEPLKELNSLGYITSFSCQGHPKGALSEIPYITGLVSDELAKRILECERFCHNVYFEIEPFYTWVPFQESKIKTLEDVKALLEKAEKEDTYCLGDFSSSFLERVLENKATTKIVIRLKLEKNREGVVGLKYIPIVKQMREYLHKTKYFLDDVEKIIKHLKGVQK